MTSPAADHGQNPDADADVDPTTVPAEPDAGAETPDPSADTSDRDGAESAGFAGLGLRTETLAALEHLGYEEPTPIQREAIPPLIEGADLLGQAATGTGKTAAFALPILERIDPDEGRPRTVALVLVPTRELAVQVSEAVFKYGRPLGVRVVPVYGGQPIHRQLRQLERGVHVVVATPGRAVDHIGRGSLNLDDVEVVVLDEADEMLDMGFAEDIEAILEATPGDRQTVLFSATMPARLDAIARRHQTDPVRVRIGTGKATPTAAGVTQRTYVVMRHHKAAALGRILDVESPGAALVFCRTRGEVDTLTETLNGRGYRAEALHGGMDQAQRERVIGRLRDGTAELLIATDVAARGLDIDTLTHVVNYDVPAAAESYVHRIGRVGRAGREGVAITLAEPREQRLLENIERLTGHRMPVQPVPTVADLRASRIDRTLATLRAALDTDDEPGDDTADEGAASARGSRGDGAENAAGDADGLDSLLDALTADHDLRAVALAAISLVHDAAGADDDEVDIPDAYLRDREGDRGRRGSNQRGRDRDGRGQRGDDRGTRRGDDRGGRKPPASAGPTGWLFVGLGKRAGVRPADLVGAIANESGLSGRDIGPIRIAERYSVVGVPEGRVDAIVDRMGTTVIRGKKTSVRRYRE